MVIPTLEPVMVEKEGNPLLSVTQNDVDDATWSALLAGDSVTIPPPVWEKAKLKAPKTYDIGESESYHGVIKCLVVEVGPLVPVLEEGNCVYIQNEGKPPGLPLGEDKYLIHAQVVIGYET